MVFLYESREAVTVNELFAEEGEPILLPFAEAKAILCGMALSLSRATQNQRHQSLKLASLVRTSKAVLQTTSEAQQAQAALLDDFFPSFAQEEAVAKPSHGLIDFNNPETVFATKSTRSLLRSYAVLKACHLKPLVHNAEALLGLSKSLVGSRTTSRLVEATFFKQFCAGTNGETIQPTLSYLRERGILPILNYAAESDIREGEDDGKAFSLSQEAALDRQQRVFMQSIADCDNTRSSRGFVGIKLTGLARPEILERVSGVLAEVGAPLDRGHSSADLRRVMAACLNPEELQGFNNLMTRVEALATAVYEKGNMRMLVDAEQTYLQPAIDAVTIALQQRFNRKGAVIMNTYQCYLKDSGGRIEADLRRSSKEGWKWGAKTVRGAYMHQERALAEARGCESPIHDSLADTHANYNSCVEHVLEHVASGNAELMVASHNQASVERALDEMQLRGIHPNSPRSGMYFGQLLGMADHLTFPLGSRGYNTYKICAYGSVNETTAFLLRRALENSDMLGGCAREVSLIRSELLRRLVASGTASAPDQSVLGPAS